MSSLVPKPIRAKRVSRGGLEPTAIARPGKKGPDKRVKGLDDRSTKNLFFSFCRDHGISRTYEITISLWNKHLWIVLNGRNEMSSQVEG